MALENYILELKNVSRIYASQGKTPVTAVDDLSLSIRQGEFFTLLGPSGCGKTTTLRMLAGFEDPDSGAIFFNGSILNGIPPNKRPTAMVFQDYALFPHMNVMENVGYGLKMKKTSTAEIALRIDETLELIGLSAYKTRYPHELSGGEQQRVAVARAIITRPGILLFDEPLSNLDARLRLKMRAELRRLQKALGITAIYVTHDQEEALSLSDRIAVLNRGRIEQYGTPAEIYSQPASTFVAHFIGRANIIECTYDRSANILIIPEIDISINMRNAKTDQAGFHAMIRPETIKLLPPAPIAHRHLQAPGTIIDFDYKGAFTTYTVKIKTLHIEVDSRDHGIRFKINDPVVVDFADCAPWIL